MTELKYLNEQYLYEDKGKIEQIGKWEDGRDFVVLVSTIFYPQGGGQPFDQGIIKSEVVSFTVEEVRFKDGVVYHVGKYESGIFTVGDEVNEMVNIERRMLNSRLHSAGHLVDIGLGNLGYKSLVPVKGYHFPDGPYVEYQGEANFPEEFEKQLEEELDRIIATNQGTKAFVVESKSDLSKYCNFIPDYIPEGKPIRVVILFGEKGFPCGGTHVKSSNELVKVYILQVKSKGGNTRVRYELDK
jgi:Ser-tRNA(Ala) deacylase AlaX